MIIHPQRGFTLVELLTTIAIIAIVTTFTVSSMQGLSARAATSSALQQLYGGFQLARSSAVYRRQLITICPLDDDGACTTDWGRAVSIFADPDNSRELTNEDNLIHVIPAPGRGSLKVRPAIKRYFQFRPIGTVHGTLGNITYCPPNGRAEDAGRLLLSFGGRMRYAMDTDGDDIVEGSDGGPISCGAT